MPLPVPATFNLRYVPPSEGQTDDLETDSEAGFKIEKEESDADVTSMKHSAAHSQYDSPRLRVELQSDEDNCGFS